MAAKAARYEETAGEIDVEGQIESIVSIDRPRKMYKKLV